MAGDPVDTHARSRDYTSSGSRSKNAGAEGSGSGVAEGVNKFNTANAWKWLTRSGPEQSTLFSPCELLIAMELIHQSDFRCWEWEESGLWVHHPVTCAQIQLSRRTGFSERTINRHLKSLRENTERPFFVNSYGLKLGAGLKLELFLRPTDVCTTQTESPNKTDMVSGQDGQSDGHVNTSIQTTPPNTGDLGRGEGDSLRKEVLGFCSDFNQMQSECGKKEMLNTSAVIRSLGRTSVDGWKMIEQAFLDAHAEGLKDQKYRMRNPTGFMIQLLKDVSD